MSVDIAGYGLCTPLGLSARITAAEMAAGTSAFVEMNVRDRTGARVRAAELSLIPRSASRMDRMLQLAGGALQDLINQVPVESWGGRLATLLVLPDHSDVGPPCEASLLARAVADMLGTVGVSTAPRTLALGRSGFFTTLLEAEELLETSQADAVLIGALDSLCDQASLQMLARSNLVLSGANPDGVLPSEGAGFVVVRRLSERGGRARVLACATSQGTPASEASPAALGQALTEVFLCLGESGRASRMLSAQTSARWWSLELRVAMGRAARVLPEPFDCLRITETLGDPGALAGLALSVAAMEWMGEDGSSPVLIYGSSDDGLTGGLLLVR
jgi:3-oxoacyl-[acyl-carrier-protein] synthase-1